ncbi:hypothetical protein EIN_084460 [Entamoeba invadens IP1]|uniref:hypothetical protein n=1 Tax=Entamoeba invadens IP1 TaxID=370355 RepID=UPI0002C3F6F5|nr:hypothetical protein EIN_084460 [Entamoeba invadens IP1]ELP85264.1 hypothetical protein EIN_084460 [Entamoeba invadens IP1]|eukprot:XP_004184610.1 hypothetical protein EIN_084460 [Entamoeba invadens IP1]
MSFDSTSCASSKPSRRAYNDPKYLTQKKVVKDMECFQEAILVALINQFCHITLVRPRKQSSVGLCCAKVKTLHFVGDEIEVMRITEEKFRPIYEKELMEGISKATAFRRYEKNKRIFVHNLLFDIALELGFFFESKLSRKSSKTASIERFERIFFKGKLLMNVQEMAVKGGLINDYLFDIVNLELTHTLQMCDKEIADMLSTRKIVDLESA